MSFISRIFGGSKETATAEPLPPPQCGHATLTPRWDAAEDMGKADRVTSYRCEGCGIQVTPAEAVRLRGVRE